MHLCKTRKNPDTPVRGAHMVLNDTRGSAFGGAILLMATIIVVVMTAAMFFGDVGMDTQQTEKPDPNIEYEFLSAEGGDDQLYIHHRGGARINPAQFAVEVSGATCVGGEGEPNGQYQVHEDFGLAEGNWFSPNMALLVDDDNPKQMCQTGTLNLDDATVTLLWENPDEVHHRMDRWTS